MPSEEDIRAYDERRSEVERQYDGNLSSFMADNSLALSMILTPLAKLRSDNLETARFSSVKSATRC
jgi:hypothetical protein